MPIRILDAATVGRIAAGEVVERPSSVVKELMENSIDAGATSITVEMRGGGIDYLRVTDNGCGIEPGQVRLAFENHATSKLQNADQLDDIRTLGFRGEALPSIASVSHVEMTTRARGQQTGVKLNVDGGQNLRVQETGCPEGTTIVMKDLFYNLPVRRAFLKKPGYEGGLVSDAVARMILGNPGISVRFINNGANAFHSFGDGKLRHAVFAVYGKETAEKMVEVDASEGGTRIFGLIGVGELGKSTRAHQSFFINGRAVRCAMLSRALEEVCRSRVTIGMYPMCALNLVIPPSSVNVNVHPNKLEVRFKDENMMRAVAERLLATAFEGERVLQLGGQDAAPAVERTTTVREILSAPSYGREAPEMTPAAAEPAQEPADQSTPRPAKPKAEKPVQMDVFHRMVDEEMKKLGATAGNALHEDVAAAYPAMDGRIREIPVPSFERPRKEGSAPVERTFMEKGAPVATVERMREESGMPPAPVAGNVPESEAREPAPQYRIIGVLMKTYILIEANDSLVMIDQHAAHERLQYEKFMAQLEAGRGSQQLLTPIVLHLSGREMALIQDNLDVLSDAGYTVEPFGEMDIQVRAVPYILGKAELKPAFMETLEALNRLRTATVDARRLEVATMACKSAVKGGDALTDSEIQTLVAKMLETGAPPTCPHGRPVMKSITRRELEKMFKRIQ